MASKSELTKDSKLSFIVGKSEVNQGAGAARNAAILQSSGTVIIIQVHWVPDCHLVFVLYFEELSVIYRMLMILPVQIE